MYSSTPAPSHEEQVVPKRLYLVRHGQTDYNVTGRMQGHLDTPLSSLGKQQADDLAPYFSRLPIGTIISSDLQRAQDTAAPIAHSLGLDMTLDSRLRETDIGDWQGMSRDEVDRDYPGQRWEWRSNSLFVPPQGESRVDVSVRAKAVVDELLASPAWDDGDVVLVTHGGTIGALTGALLGLPPEELHIFTGTGNTHWAELSLGTAEAEDVQNSLSRWYLETWNDGVHADSDAHIPGEISDYIV